MAIFPDNLRRVLFSMGLIVGYLAVRGMSTEVYLLFMSVLTSVVVYLFVAEHGPKRFDPNSPQNKHMSAQVLVLGDIGRSPRMQYHALSIAKHGGQVQLIGYRESGLLPALLESKNVSVWALQPPSRLLSKLPFIVGGPLKVLYQVYGLLSVLLYGVEPSKWLIVQNPPSIPTLVVAALTCRVRNTGLIIDWHNYGWTILAGTRGQRHPFVRASKVYEAFFGRIAPTANLAVTAAMKADLQTAPYNIRTPIVAMHDRPAAIFRPISNQQDRSVFLSGILQTADYVEDILAGRMRLLVSSTSWTPDEDFSILLDALVSYAASPQRVPLLVVITGRGPQKALYEAEIARLTAAGRLGGIEIRTAFLSFANYANLLAAADLGICLHMSSSGLDLPMKVVDMFGAGLPVLAYSRYQSFGELVKEGVNGMGFGTSAELMGGLLRLLDAENGQLAKLKAGAVEEGSRRWDEEWDEVVKPLLGFT